jgi:hypothetical protein
MAEHEKPDASKALKQDSLVDQLMPDPTQIRPDVRAMAGFLGKSTRPGFWRLYLTPSMNEFVEIAEGDIIRSQSLTTEQNPLGGTLLWVKRDAELQLTHSTPLKAQAEFLQGDIAASLAGGPGMPGPLGRGPGGQIIFTMWCTYGCTFYCTYTFGAPCSQFTYCTILCCHAA